MLFFVLQVDLLKSTSLPLMKRFGVEGEAFVVKVWVCSGTVAASSSLFSLRKDVFRPFMLGGTFFCCLLRW